MHACLHTIGLAAVVARLVARGRLGLALVRGGTAGAVAEALLDAGAVLVLEAGGGAVGVGVRGCSLYACVFIMRAPL